MHGVSRMYGSWKRCWFTWDFIFWLLEYIEALVWKHWSNLTMLKSRTGQVQSKELCPAGMVWKIHTAFGTWLMAYYGMFFWFWIFFPHMFVWGSCFWFCILLPAPSAPLTFVTHHLSHTTLSHTISLTQLCHPPSFTWQAWHLRHWAGSGGALGRALGRPLGRAWSPRVPRHFAWQAWHLVTWQAWHLVTSTLVSRGRRGTWITWWHLPSFCVAGVALGDIHHRFAWRLGALGRPGRCATLRGRRGTWRHPP